MITAAVRQTRADLPIAAHQAILTSETPSDIARVTVTAMLAFTEGRPSLEGTGLV